MATRFYLNTGHAADLSLTRPLPSGFAWEQNVTSLPTTRRIGTTARGTANNAANPYGSLMSNLGTGSNPCDILFFQGISGPLAAQTISGTVQGVAVVREANSSDNLYTQLAVYVVNAAGTLVATLFNGASSGGSEWNSPSANNRNIPRQGSAAITSYDCADGDRIVIEIGCRTESTRTTVGAYMYLGDPGGSDLPTGNGTSNNTTINPWVELSADLTFGYTEDASISANAVIKSTVASAVSADAWIESASGGTITGGIPADAVIFATIPGTVAADAVLLVTRSGSVSADAIISDPTVASITASAIIQDTPAVIIDDPFDDPGTVAGEWNARWTLIKGIENSTSEHGRNPTVGAFIYDNSNTVLDSERGGYAGRGQFTKGVFTARAKFVQSVDQLVNDVRFAVYLRHSGETQGIGYYDADYVAVELIMQPAGAMALQIRSDYQTVQYGPVDLTAELGTWSDGDEFYIKGWAKGSRFKGKVWRVGDPEPRWQINQVISGMPTIGYKGMAANTDTSWKPVEWNIRQAWVYNLDFSVDADAVIVAQASGSVSADAVVLATSQGSISADAWILPSSVAVDGSITADAVQRRTEPHSITAGASILAIRSATITADAVIAATYQGTVASDAVIEKTVQGAVAADAILSSTRTDGVQAAAVILSPASGYLISAAVIQAIVAGSITASAYAIHIRIGSVSADALVNIVRSGSIVADAVYLRRVTGSIAADAVMTRPTPGPQVDWAMTVRELDHSVTARELDHAMTARELDWSLNQTVSRSVTADAWIV